ncbi:hypothetical protein [Spelaeicoccus albus]|uniref:Uncharacterized protein n=1 Tax=Spelaeicoccus albus TaxID=1280376 RepID=A0A7Z0D2E9_9MICO|nr:hypothetical protein [Spelaeicoccus albus]NYI67606.1 hypothetical protein [Spelaeicoccus albus]
MRLSKSLMCGSPIRLLGRIPGTLDDAAMQLPIIGGGHGTWWV